MLGLLGLFIFPSTLLQSLDQALQMMNYINRCTISIQYIRNILKRKATWDEPIEKA
jgi:hypothetical protein